MPGIGFAYFLILYLVGWVSISRGWAYIDILG